MELADARRLAWAAEHGGQPLPAEVAEKVGYVLAKGAEVKVAPPQGHFIEIEAGAKA